MKTKNLNLRKAQEAHKAWKARQVLKVQEARQVLKLHRPQNQLLLILMMQVIAAIALVLAMHLRRIMHIRIAQ